MSKITIYNGNTAVHSDDYPAAWGITALQATARRWMKYTNGTRYTIEGAGVSYQSKPSRKAAQS